MKHLKILGLVVVAAAALMAMVGASTAAAETTFCKANETPCSESNMIPGTQNIKAILATGTKVTAVAGFATVTCEEAVAEGKASTTTTTPSGPISKMTFGKCKDSLGRNCDVIVSETSPGAFGILQVHAIAGTMNGNLTASGFTVTVHCFNKPLTSEAATSTNICRYSGTITAGITLTGGDPASGGAVNASVPIEQPSDFICASPGKITGSYTVSEPNPLWVSPGV